MFSIFALLSECLKYCFFKDFNFQQWVGRMFTFIGWSEEQRARHLQLVVNNTRFLVLPSDFLIRSRKNPIFVES